MLSHQHLEAIIAFNNVWSLLLQTCYAGSNLEGGAPSLPFPFRLQTECPVCPPQNLVSAQSLIIIFSCSSVPVIAFLTDCDQLPHPTLVIFTIKFVTLGITLHLRPPLKLT